MMKWLAVCLIVLAAMMPQPAEAQGRRVAAGIAAAVILGAIIAGAQNSAASQRRSSRRAAASSRKAPRASSARSTAQSSPDIVREASGASGSRANSVQQSNLRF